MALVGPSGCGKSTAIQLLERFYDVLGGTIKIDGKDIKTLNIRHMRNHIALVGQEPTLFNLSVRDNIAYGLTDVREDEIINAAKLANIDDFVQSLPDGYNTSVGGRGKGVIQKCKRKLRNGFRAQFKLSSSLEQGTELLI